jgi:long-subunit acyl-CoA synthetase (AMP-forming)
MESGLIAELAVSPDCEQSAASRAAEDRHGWASGWSSCSPVERRRQLYRHCERAEIAIKGETVTRGYLSPPTANAEAFSHDCLRTGDEGSFDEDGYLTLVGRLN